MGNDVAIAASFDRSPSAWPARLALAAAAASLLVGLGRLVHYARWAIGYRWGLDYGEGTVWQQMHGIVAGDGYAPLRQMPAFVYQYPPLYHLVTAALVGSTGLDELAAGRIVSLAAALIAAALVGVLAAAMIGERSRARSIAAAVAASVFVTLPVVVTWAVTMRVDMLATALTLAGTAAAIRAAAPGRRGSAWAIAAGLAFTAALYTRQTCLPGPVAAVAVLWIARRRAAWLLLAAALASGLAVLALLGGRDFLVHIVAYNMNRIIWRQGWLLGLVLVDNIVPIALGAAGAVAAWRQLGPATWRTLPARLAADRRLVAMAMLLMMTMLKTLMLPALLKSGASDNYFIDWFAPLAALAGLAVAPVVEVAVKGKAPSRPLLLMLLGLGLPARLLEAPLADPVPDPTTDAARAALVARIAASPLPVVAEDMVLVLRAGRPVVWEPAIIAELGGAGLYDERALARRVRRGEFGFFVTSPPRYPAYTERFRPVVRDAIDAAYPRRQRIGEYELHLPASAECKNCTRAGKQ